MGHMLSSGYITSGWLMKAEEFIASFYDADDSEMLKKTHISTLPYLIWKSCQR